MFILEKKRLLVQPSNTKSGVDRKDTKRLFDRACSEKARFNSLNLKEVKFWLGMRNKLFMRMRRHYNKLSREVMTFIS